MPKRNRRLGGDAPRSSKQVKLHSPHGAKEQFAQNEQDFFSVSNRLKAAIARKDSCATLLAIAELELRIPTWSPGFFEIHGNDFSIEYYAQKRNFLVLGGGFDIERASKTFIKELRDGKLGQFSFE